MMIFRVLLPVFLLFLVGCAGTRVVSQDPHAEIFLDNRSIGVGEVRVNRIGPPNRVVLESRRGEKVVGRTDMSRSFKLMTVVWGVCSYYTGFYWGWYYPESVTIPLIALPDPRARALASPWSSPGESVWMQPLK